MFACFFFLVSFHHVQCKTCLNTAIINSRIDLRGDLDWLVGQFFSWSTLVNLIKIRTESNCEAMIVPELNIVSPCTEIVSKVCDFLSLGMEWIRVLI